MSAVGARVQLGLGTAQLGLDYGIANRAGRPDRATAAAILERAHRAGVRCIDTAPAYGTAEAVLGELLPAAGTWRLVTKTTGGAVPGDLGRALAASLQRLRRSTIAGLLVHDRRDLLGPAGDRLWAELCQLRDAGLVERIGVSVYHPDEVRTLLARYPLELVQLPLSVFDQRARSSGVLAALAAAGVEVHVRSVFLQGLLLMDPDRLPAALAAARPRLGTFAARARELGLSPLQAALGFVAGIAGVAVAICGVEAPAQLDELVAALATRIEPEVFADLATDDLGVVDPSTWQVSR